MILYIYIVGAQRRLNIFCHVAEFIERTLSMGRKCGNHALQANPRHREEVTGNIHSHMTLRRQLKSSSEMIANLLSCQPRVTVTSCFVDKVNMDLESIYTVRHKVKHRPNSFLEKRRKISSHEYFLVLFIRINKLVTIYN